MLKQILTDLSRWLYELSDWFHPFDTPENWWGNEEWEQFNQDVDDSLYLAEVISRQIMGLTK